jgi:hypothetical protein
MPNERENTCWMKTRRFQRIPTFFTLEKGLQNVGEVEIGQFARRRW